MSGKWGAVECPSCGRKQHMPFPAPGYEHSSQCTNLDCNCHIYVACLDDGFRVSRTPLDKEAYKGRTGCTDPRD